MGYSIKVLSNEEFEKLPYRHTDIALGLADPKQNTAYVRYSAYPELNKYLIDHEFEHLLEEHGTDEIDGVRYKIPLLGPLISGIGSLATKALPALGGALGGAVSKAPSFLGNIGSSALNLGKSAIGGIKNIGSSVMNLFGGGGSSRGGSGFNPLGFLGGGSKGISPGQVGYGQLTPSQLSYQNSLNFPSGSALGGGSRSGGLLSSFMNPSTLLGGLSLGAGLLKKLPRAPELPESVNQLRSQVQAGGSPLGQQAQGVISGNLSKQFNPLTSEELTAATADLDRSRLMDIKRLEGLYASARPGTDYTTDTQYKQDLAGIERNYAESKSNVVANRTRGAEDAFNVNQYRNVQSALGASDQQMAQLAQLAQLDVEQIMTQLQLDYASALNFKQVFQNIGGQLLLSGLGAASPFSSFGV